LASDSEAIVKAERLFLFFIFKLRSLGRPAIDLIFAQTPVLSTSVLF